MDARDVTPDDLQAAWQPWIDEVCAAVSVDPARVDVALIQRLAKRVSREFERPMAPVAAHILGLAVAAQPDASPQALSAALADAIPRAPHDGAGE